MKRPDDLDRSVLDLTDPAKAPLGLVGQSTQAPKPPSVLRESPEESSGMENPTDTMDRSSDGAASTASAASTERQDKAAAINVQDVNVYYGDFRAIREVTLPIYEHEITALIGPSGCGKSTLLRSMNRMNDLIDSARLEGTISYHGIDIYGPDVDAVEVRRKIGMVFQKPNPFPKSIYDNITYGPKIAGVAKSDFDGVVEEALKAAALWDEVKDRLKSSALGLSGGQQQRLCIARAIATRPDVLLMDEPCSALDPIATGRIEDLMQGLKSEYTIAIVTHNMQQAARVSDHCAFFTTETMGENDRRTGVLVEFDETERIFSNPSDGRTESYVTGRFG